MPANLPLLSLKPLENLAQAPLNANPTIALLLTILWTLDESIYLVKNVFTP